jgi:hypothetical protein
LALLAVLVVVVVLLAGVAPSRSRSSLPGIDAPDAAGPVAESDVPAAAAS